MRPTPAAMHRFLILLFALFACARVAPSEGQGTGPYVASSRGEVYYRTGCGAAERLSEKNRIYFRSIREAEAAGYRPSTARGCGPERPLVRESKPTPSGAPATGTCTVSRIYDGDTVTCRSGERIRLLLIDTPEMGQGEIGREARTALLRILPLGTTARVELDVEKQDRYERTLAYLWLEDGRMVNEEMARSGYALVLSYPPNVRHIDRIRSAVEEARAARRALWSTSAFECSPRDYRARRCGRGDRR